MKHTDSLPPFESVAPPVAPQPASATAPSGFSNHAIHLVRTATQVNLSLSQMADQKASLLMGATFVVFTISVGQARGGDFSWSLTFLAFFSFISAMCAVFAVLPSIRPPKRSKGEENILFFGNFARMDEAEFSDRILAELHSDETVFRTMLRDVHQNGRVLQYKKYRFLSLAYRLFLVGLTITFVSFILEHSLT
ncbi:MAG: DUF5706 domain-containing protein [Blastomonas sp.]